MRRVKWLSLAAMATTGTLFMGLGSCGPIGLAAVGLGALLLLGGGLGNLTGTGT